MSALLTPGPHWPPAARRALAAWRRLTPARRRLAALAVVAALLLAAFAAHEAPSAQCARPASSFDALAWPASARAPFPLAAAAREASADAQFTVVLNTFKRPDLLRRALSHYASCPRVAAVRVVWSEPAAPPSRDDPDADALFPGPPGFVRYDAHPTTSINNRFLPLAGLTTAALLSVDDDMVPPCAALDDAFAAWKAAPAALVGFYPRLHVGARGCGLRYVSAEPALAWHGRYSLVLTKAAFLHARYLSLYSEAMPAGIRDYVAKRRECEDIAMAFLVANATGRPSVFVAPPLRFWAGAKWDGAGRAGLSAGGVKDHHAMRGRCVADFAAMYGGRVPLRTAPLRDSAQRAKLPPLLPALRAASRRAALPQRRRVCAAAADAPETCLASALAALAAGDEASLLSLLLPPSDDRAAVSGDTGALSAAAHALDPASRRVLLRHADARVLSLLQLPPRGAAARVAATSASGEAGVFSFALERATDDAGPWRVASVTRDDAGDADAAAALALPHCGAAPEVVAMAFLGRLAAGGVAAAGALATARGVEHVNVSRGGRSTNGAKGGGELRTAEERFACLLRSPAYALLVRHVSAVWAGPPALDAGGGWVRAVRVTGGAAAGHDAATISLRLALTPLREPDPDGGGECDEEMQAGDAAAGGAVCWRVDALRRVAES